MKKQSFIVIGIVIMLLTACHPKQYIYLMDMPLDNYVPITNKMETRIKPDDRLSIVVKSKKQELAVPFNAHSYQVKLTGETTSSGNDATTGYLVDESGFIDFPILGKIQARGLTCRQLSESIKKELQTRNLIMDPFVTTQITNFTYSVLGEAKKVGTVEVKGKERVTILDAVAQAGSDV